MKSIHEKRMMEMKRIVKDLYRMKRNQETNQNMIIYDYLHMRVKLMQKKGLLWNIDIPEVRQDDYEKLRKITVQSHG